MKVSAVTKGPVMMCLKSSDSFPEYLLVTINSHKLNSVQPLKRASSDLKLSSRPSAAAGRQPVRLIIAASGGSEHLCFALNFPQSPFSCLIQV